MRDLGVWGFGGGVQGFRGSGFTGLGGLEFRVGDNKILQDRCRVQQFTSRGSHWPQEDSREPNTWSRSTPFKLQGP